MLNSINKPRTDQWFLVGIIRSISVHWMLMNDHCDPVPGIAAVQDAGKIHILDVKRVT